MEKYTERFMCSTRTSQNGKRRRRRRNKNLIAEIQGTKSKKKLEDWFSFNLSILPTERGIRWFYMIWFVIDYFTKIFFIFSPPSLFLWLSLLPLTAINFSYWNLCPKKRKLTLTLNCCLFCVQYDGLNNPLGLCILAFLFFIGGGLFETEKKNKIYIPYTVSANILFFFFFFLSHRLQITRQLGSKELLYNSNLFIWLLYTSTIEKVKDKWYKWLITKFYPVISHRYIQETIIYAVSVNSCFCFFTYDL